MIHIFQTLLVLVFPALVITAALRDVVSYTIPNWISLALIAAFPVAALAQGHCEKQLSCGTRFSAGDIG